LGRKEEKAYKTINSDFRRPLPPPGKAKVFANSFTSLTKTMFDWLMMRVNEKFSETVAPCEAFLP